MKLTGTLIAVLFGTQIAVLSGTQIAMLFGTLNGTLIGVLFGTHIAVVFGTLAAYPHDRRGNETSNVVLSNWARRRTRLEQSCLCPGCRVTRSPAKC